MAQTTFGSLKARIEALGLNLSAYPDVAPTAVSDLLRDKAKPYVTIVEGIASVPDPIADHAISTGLELAEVNLWQRWRDPSTDASNVSPSLAPALRAGLHGAPIDGIGQPGQKARVYTCLVRNMRKRLEEDNNIIRHIIDVDLKREL